LSAADRVLFQGGTNRVFYHLPHTPFERFGLPPFHQKFKILMHVIVTASHFQEWILLIFDFGTGFSGSTTFGKF
jgi:hypothetical protein